MLILALGFVQGLVFSGLTPPWQSPDEPRHFEYVQWLIQTGQPSFSGDASSSIEKEILLSMYQFNFWGYVHRPTPSAVPSSFSQTPFLASAHSQIEYQPPLYYLLLSMVYRLVAESGLLTQLLVLRTFSTLLGTLVVLFAYLLCRELFPKSRFLILGVPAFIALFPMYWFIAGSVNNDVLAAAAVSALLYLLVRILVRGVSLSLCLLAVILVVVSVLSKRTALIALPISVIAVPLYLWSRHVTIPRKWRLAIIASAALVFLVGWQIITLRGNDADGWVELDHHWMDDRSSTYSRTGSYSLHVRKDAETWQYIAQFLPTEQTAQLKGESVSLQAWVRGASNDQPGFIMLSDGVGSKIASFQTGTQWQLVQLSFDVSSTASFVRIALGPGNASPRTKGDVYFDDVTLTDSATADGSTNYVRNGSAETGSWRWQNSGVVRYMDAAISGWTAFIGGGDFASSTLGMYWPALTTGFQSFWGVFGWMAAPLGGLWYQAILIMLLAAFAGLLVGAVQSLQGRATAARHQRGGLWLLLVSVVLGVSMILITHNPAAVPNTLPQGRYLFPILVPGTVLFILGLQKLVPARYHGTAIFCCISGFFLFDSAVLITNVIRFFYG